MSETLYTADDKVPATNVRARMQGEKVIEDVEEIKRASWNI